MCLFSQKIGPMCDNLEYFKGLKRNSQLTVPPFNMDNECWEVICNMLK